MQTATAENVVAIQQQDAASPLVATSTTAMIHDEAMLAKMLGFAELMATSLAIAWLSPCRRCNGA